LFPWEQFRAKLIAEIAAWELFGLVDGRSWRADVKGTDPSVRERVQAARSGCFP
jgi:hypothetical protein